MGSFWLVRVSYETGFLRGFYGFCTACFGCFAELAGEFFEKLRPNLAANCKNTAVPPILMAVPSKNMAVRLNITAVPSRITAVPSRITVVPPLYWEKGSAYFNTSL